MIELSWRGRVAVLTLDRPDKHNALTAELCERIRTAVASAAQARALVLTGNGRSFCSGADLDEVHTAGFRDELYRMLHAVTAAPVPVVAAVHGAAIGAGTQLAIAADLRVVSPAARFAVPTARIGLAVDPWTIRRLALLAGHGAARRMLLACDPIDADAALACGLADRPGDLDDALDWAAGMADLAPLTVGYTKRVLGEVFEPGLAGDVATELDAAFEACWASGDFAEGRLSRAEKRPPVFRGR
ncbi:MULTISPECIES: enoyl-CoA hydratase [Pseudonocardia]|uniref:Enoyl-CoA hydratase/isomerase n=2 Tax=Pseudonocardia TaxID=1847 RepID=A0ABQ0S3C5_9PSEU|nr:MULTISPECIES: enoyl-CoA hydratase [Pseudonocardia]OSY38206.1 putative enoyl-CoA hydratase echA6 [Pseudonocardia autotrophica]TDN71069.1 enoyl-CoA hydratase [Pseudonocardia autotrophica]BBG01738.1 putative enoyl-CoA hydratase/isomerase [Pseudonocardia autotrophica]GEC27387.1 putative enoyl-CoA hydratase/isomerase [Pseudonocardia saturnea]